MQENRQNVRLGKSLMVSYLPVKQLLRGGARSVNISMGGICLPSFKWLEIHTILDLEIFLAADVKPIKATGEVKWIKKRNDVKFPFEIGVRFIKIEPSLQDKLAEFILKGGNEEVDWV